MRKPQTYFAHGRASVIIGGARAASGREASSSGNIEGSFRVGEILESLPGVGPYTAGAVRAFAFSEPELFIETNIRRVFIHFFSRTQKAFTTKKFCLI